MSDNPSVFFFGPLPPPTHGMAVVNAQMVELLRTRSKVYEGNTSPGSLERGPVYHLQKVRKVCGIIPRMLKARLTGCTTLYGSPDDGLGGIWTLAIILWARILAMRIVLHHHSFKYFTTKSQLMAAITFVAGKTATHVTLGPKMEEKLRRLYPSVSKVINCENSVALPERQVGKSTGPIVVGMLSNLTVEKGTLIFLDFVEMALRSGLNLRAILAGPTPDPVVKQAIETVIANNPGSVSYVGPVYGDEKEKFFAAINVFIFPTSATEAFGLVLLESLVRGVPVIGFERGCNGQLNSLPGVTLFADGESFTPLALEKIKELQGNEINHDVIRRAAMHRNLENIRRQARLADYIVVGGEGL